MSESTAPGLRLQIVLALAGLMILAFVPLYVAVASLTRATVLDASARAAERTVSAIAAHVDEARRAGGEDAAKRALEGHVTRGDVESAELRAEPAAIPRTEIVRTARGRAVEVRAPLERGSLVARTTVDESASGAAMLRLVALYMAVFAVALITFAYFALTRLIVRPVDALVRAADRVATGARTLDIPKAGARELSELGASVQSMTNKILADEAASRKQLEELTRAAERLREAQSQLVRSERMASVGRLAAGVAHEVGNPIAAMMGMQELLLDGDMPTSDQRDFLVRMKKETERIHGVIRDLLDFARPEKAVRPGDSPAPPADVRAVIGDVLALVKPQKGFKELELSSDLEGADLVVALPAPQLTQVLLNIVLNAGAALGKSARTGKIVVRARREGARVRIEVDDTGPGVPEDLRDKIFDPFMTTKDVGEGTGLGLSVCRGLVEAAGGTIAVDPAYDAGARFVVVLPAA